MSWEKVTFHDLYGIESKNGIYKSSEYHGRGAKIINMGELFAYGFIGKQDMRRIEVTNKELINFGVQKGDLLFARRSLVESGAGKSSIVWEIEEPMVYESSLIRVRLNKTLCYPLFYYYWFQSYDGKSEISSLINGVNVKGIKSTALKDIKVVLPTLQVQMKIAHKLYVYDELIDNYQKQIKLLEEVAQRLYKEWFVDLHFPGYEDVEIVDGVPKGWKKNSMNEIAEYLNGYAFKPSDWGTEGLPIIKIKEMNDGITENTPRNSGEYIPGKYLIKAGDILFSWSATLTAMIWDSEDGLLNQHLFKVVPKAGITREFMFQSILKTLEEFKNLTTGSTMKHIQRGKLEQVYINVPTKDLMNEYSKQGETIRQEILILKKKISLLEEARDRLLPKLMSGEIEV